MRLVYVTEYITRNVYRISPEGVLTLLVEVPSGWIPNIKWGRGLGGFERDVMYVADRNGEGLFGIHIGREGAKEYYDIATR